MKAVYRCPNQLRRTKVKTLTTDDGKPVLNGIDYLEVAEDVGTLTVFFIHDFADMPGSYPEVSNFIIDGGKPVNILKANPVDTNLDEKKRKKVILTISGSGDFGPYKLRLVESALSDRPPKGYDPQLSEVEFVFRLKCRNEYDCTTAPLCSEEPVIEPQIDYMARDYASFRRLVTDRLSAVVPDWNERNPADLGVAIIEAMAYVGDYLSYYQDAVATEAYLGTARRRESIRRHARLLDYQIHDGCNARVWVHVKVEPREVSLSKGTKMLTRFTEYEERISIDSPAYRQAMHTHSLVFEAMHDEVLYHSHNEIYFYTWDEDKCCLPKDATSATLRNPALVSNPDKTLRLVPGQVLVFEEVRNPKSKLKEDADPAHRQAVRLTQVSYDIDPLNNLPIVEISWAQEDALKFPLCLWEVLDEKNKKVPVSVARGNIVLCDHGNTEKEDLKIKPQEVVYKPLGKGPITQQGRTRNRKGHMILFDPEAPASSAVLNKWQATDILPDIRLFEGGIEHREWIPVKDLLNSDRFECNFVVEMLDDGGSRLRFGDNVHGRTPEDKSTLEAIYRVGNGKIGNIGQEGIAHIVSDDDGIVCVRNPLPASGGMDPEPIEKVRLDAPQAFYIQERAVTEEDYAALTERHNEVQKAVAMLRWTGSWHTMLIIVDRKNGLPVDSTFKEELKAFLERYRLTGQDIEVNTPVFVPLNILLEICVTPGFVQADVKKALMDAFCNYDLPGNLRGFFHPDNFTFGQTVFLSQIVAMAAKTPGVQWVKPEKFHKWGHPEFDGISSGQITMQRLEIARLDNDPNHPENGHIDFDMRGGL